MITWLHAFRQTTTYLGILVVLAIWGGIYLLTREEHERAAAEGIRQGSNLARVFEEYISRVIGGADRVLLTLRESYERDPKQFDITRSIGPVRLRNNLVMNFGVIDAGGRVKHSTVLLDLRTLENMSDRDYFRFHADSPADELYISKPMIGRMTGAAIFQLTRRVMARNGAFGGVVLASIDIRQLEKFYNSIDIGHAGIVELMGFDGIIRARSGLDPAAQSFVGKSGAEARLISLFRQAPVGSYWNFENSAKQLDGIRRLIAYHVVEGFPLVATVGLAESDIFEQSNLTARKYILIALVLTAIVIGAIVIGARRQQKLSAIVAALEQSKQSLEQTNVRFNTALENMGQGLCMFDRNQRLIVCNERYGDMYGLTREQTKPGTTSRQILEARVAVGNCPEDGPTYVEHILAQLDRPEPYSTVTELRDGRYFAVNNQPMPGGGWVAVHQDITAQKRAEMQIAYMARHDGLTALANRTVLMERIEEALARWRRQGDGFSVFMLDLDLFKTINDSLGHPVGDELLKVVAARLSACMRETDTVARLGGDEFAVLATMSGEEREAAVITANRLLEAVATPYNIDGQQLDVGTSIGIALAPEHGADVEQLMKSADLALYKAKSEGRNTFRFFEDAMGTEARRRRALQVDLRNALTNNEFALDYQPIVEIESGEITGVEALVRWRHPQRGMIAPGEFIALAEESGLINALGEWVLRKACSDAIDWPAHVKVSVNLSPVQLRNASPIDLFCRVLGESSLPPERLELEVTESAILHSSKENLETLHQLQLMGISVVLDDFGTGYSSLTHLRLFPFGKIKIDRSFVRELENNAESTAIVSAMASLGHGLSIGTVAEGVETEDQLVLVRAAGCTHAQGYLFGLPCPAADLEFRRTRHGKESHGQAYRWPGREHGRTIQSTTMPNG